MLRGREHCLIAERRKRITVAQVTALLRRVAGLPISVEPIQPDRAFEQILSVARQRNLTEYDAASPSTAFWDSALPRLQAAPSRAVLDGDESKIAVLDGHALVVSSGVALIVPAKYITELLQKNNVLWLRASEPKTGK